MQQQLLPEPEQKQLQQWRFQLNASCKDNTPLVMFDIQKQIFVVWVLLNLAACYQSSQTDNSNENVHLGNAMLATPITLKK